jgi:hypothetical protein
MSQPPASQSVATAGFTCLCYYQLCDRLLSLHDSLEDAKHNKDTALEWVKEYCARMVHWSPFLFLPCVLISSQTALEELGHTLGSSPDTDVDIIDLRDTAHKCLFLFATSTWSGEVPAFVGEFSDMVTRLPPGVSLGESLPDAFSVVPQVTVSGHDATLPVVPSPAVGPSLLAILSPSTMPPPSISPSSGSGVSPTTTASSGTGSSSLLSLGLRVRHG